MAISTTWSVNNMTHNDADGGVVTVYYSCVATDGTYSATEGGKLRLSQVRGPSIAFTAVGQSFAARRALIAFSSWTQRLGGAAKWKVSGQRLSCSHSWLHANTSRRKGGGLRAQRMRKPKSRTMSMLTCLARSFSRSSFLSVFRAWSRRRRSSLGVGGGGE